MLHPEIEMPVTLTEESSLEFSNYNKPLPTEFIQKFFLPHENGYDDLTEIIPCFKIAHTDDFYALVYWKAGLLTYEYKLITFSKVGEFIDGKVIAGTITNGETIIRTVATIDPDFIIHTVSGEQSVHSRSNLNTESKAFAMEILATGEIIFSLNENYND